MAGYCIRVAVRKAKDFWEVETGKCLGRAISLGEKAMLRSFQQSSPVTVSSIFRNNHKARDKSNVTCAETSSIVGVE
ncbi:MAG: hypothetical protein WCL39_03780 [Armatimonadota bacterium]